MMDIPGPVGPVFSAKTERIIGRQSEIDRLDHYLHDRGPRRFIYFWGGGGLGKTRLLMELQDLVRKAGPGFYTTGIIDLFHTDTHGTSDIERAIVEGLDPQGNYFPHYRHERQHYQLLRERGADPAVLEECRANLSEIFVQDCHAMALDAAKLVICFDTIELLQYESLIVEEIAGLDSIDARVKPWLLDKLSQLKNVLVVFAGRPKKPESAHTRLKSDLERAFGQDLDIVELAPLSQPEAREIIAALTTEPGVELIPHDLLPVVHRLTGGTPIYLHLLVDLLQPPLSVALGPLFELFGQYRPLVDAGEDDSELKAARKQIKAAIVDAIFNHTGDLGGYLRYIALMPKGVDKEILHHALGVPESEAERLLDRLAPLSFVKRFIAPRGAEHMHGERLYLHEEMYDLLTLSGVVDNVGIYERSIAHTLVVNYYDPHLAVLRQELEASGPEGRPALRERLQKLQVERLYYRLVSDPKEGYREYQALGEDANNQRWVGYSMRLLDEFLRFFNSSRERETVRQQLDDAGVTQERVIRDSALMWVERFWWWGHYDRVQSLGRRILDNPTAVCIDPDRDLDILGNVCALWARTFALLEGYNEEVVQEAESLLQRLPALAGCTPRQALARARLLVTVGYHRDLGGAVQRGVRAYAESLAAFRLAGEYPDEYSMVLNNLAYAHATQGRFVQGRKLAHEALRMNEARGHDYATGLTLNTLAEIAQMRENFPRAIEYGREALDIFQQVEDAHGTALARTALAKAARRMGKHETQVGRRPEEAQERLKEAIGHLQSAEDVLKKAGMGSERLLRVYSELGRTYRDMGNLLRRQEEGEEALRNYHEAQRMFELALAGKLPQIERANVLEDLAETRYMAGEVAKANSLVLEVEKLIGPEYQIVPGEKVPAKGLPTQGFSALGKIELLRGQMAFDYHQFEEGIRHFLLAYAYFKHFSPDTVAVDALISYLYDRLQRLPASELASLMHMVRETVNEQDFGVDVSSLARILEDLLGG